MPVELVAAIAVVAAAGLMRGFAGVGSGMLMAPFFVQLFGPVQTVVIIILLEWVVTVQLIPGLLKQINWRLILPMGVAAMVLMPLGNKLLVSMDPYWIGRVVGLIVTVFAIILMTGWRYPGPRPLPVTMAVGGLSGVLMALTSLGNPPVMVYLLSGSDSSATSRANFTGYFAITLTALILIMALGGQLEGGGLLRAAVLLPVFMFCAWLGARLFRQANEKQYRSVALIILLGAGLYGLLV